MTRIMSELEAKEAVMNGARVRYRTYPPYLRCSVCGGDGTAERPYYMRGGGCASLHDPGWEIVSAVTDEMVERAWEVFYTTIRVPLTMPEADVRLGLQAVLENVPS